MLEIQYFNKFRLNAGLDEESAKHVWQRLKGWPQAENIHQLFTARPSPS